MLCSVILNLLALWYDVFSHPLPSVDVTNLLCDMLWHRSRGDKKADSPDASITIAFLWNTAISPLPASPLKASPLNLLSSLFCIHKPQRSCSKRISQPFRTGRSQVSPSRAALAARQAKPSCECMAARPDTTTQIRSMWWGSLCSLSLHLPLCQLGTYSHVLRRLRDVYVLHMYSTYMCAHLSWHAWM